MKNNYANNAIYEYYHNQGFNFGNTFYMNGQSIQFSYSGYYEESINLNMNYTPEEIEAFKVSTS